MVDSSEDTAGSCVTLNGSGELTPKNAAWAILAAAAGSDASAQACSAMAHSAGRAHFSLTIPFCFGASGCPWCMLGISQSEHGDFKRVSERVLGMRTSFAFSDQAHPEEMQSVMFSLSRCLAAACLKHAELAFPSQYNGKAKQKLAELGILEAEGNATESAAKAEGTSDAIPPPPGIPAPMAPIPSQPISSKGTADQMWGVPGQQVMWLSQKLLVHTTRVRGVKVSMDASGHQWAYLKEADAQRILQWYDRAALMDVLKAATKDPVTGLPQDYRWEGGTFITVWTAIIPGAPVMREAYVTYMTRDRPG